MKVKDTMSDQNKDRLTRFIEEIWSQGKIDAAGDYLASHYTIHHDPGDPWDGQTLDLAGYKERVRASRAPFPDQRFTIEALVSEGDLVVAMWHWAGTHQEDILGFRASGKTITTSGATVYYFDDNRISGHWQIADRMSVYQQLAG